MRHNHLVTDSDSYFVIDPITRQLSNGTSKKLSLIKGDHNSERFTFELPLYVEGHDMSLCNKVEVHFINLNTKTKAKNEDVYIVTDHDDAFKVNPDNPDTVIAEWLISRNVTQHAGSLSFVIRYMCLGEDGTVDYAWNTAIYSGITVLDSIDNSDIVVDEYSDVLQEWYEKLLSAFDGNIDLNSKEAVKFWVGSQAEYAALEEIVDGCLYIITDDGTLEDIRADLDNLIAVVGGSDNDSSHQAILAQHTKDIAQHTTDIGSLDTKITDNTTALQAKDTELEQRFEELADFINSVYGERELEVVFPSIYKPDAMGSIYQGSLTYIYNAVATSEYEIMYNYPKCSIDDIFIGTDYTTVVTDELLTTITTYSAKFTGNKLTVQTHIHAESPKDTLTLSASSITKTANFWT